ncbi:unnamed protein product [Orchesella dallaii]|uniref:Uncharacterized protein n=1 Tax=Orchesella dallaii TaxID=48710 RepID=A0ABP1PWZ7_9HEXA
MSMLFSPSSRCRHCLSPLSQRQYISHIKMVHHAFGYDEESEDGSYTFTNWTDYINEEDSTFYDDYFLFDGKYFVSSGEIRDGILYEWISLIGNPEESEKYRATLTLASPKFKVPRIEWTIRVLPFTMENRPDFKYCSGIPVQPILAKFVSRNCQSDRGDMREFVWKQKVTITKVDANSS